MSGSPLWKLINKLSLKGNYDCFLSWIVVLCWSHKCVAVSRFPSWRGLLRHLRSSPGVQHSKESLLDDGWWSFSLRLTQLLSHVVLCMGSKCWLNVTTNHSFNHLTHKGPVFGSLSIFLFCSASLSPLPLVFRSQPTLSVGRTDRRCLANAPAGSVLVLVSISARNCKSTNKWPLLKMWPDLSTSLAHGGMSGELCTETIGPKRTLLLLQGFHHFSKSVFTWK